MRTIKSAAVAALTLALLAIFAGPAAARDRNHDRIPDRWEKRHHLSLRVNQARRDQDHDGLRNRAEFKARMDPRDADTDDDGTEDADEHAGTIRGFDAATRTVTIGLFGGGTVSGLVSDATEIECEGARAARDGENSGPGGGEDHSGPGGGDDRGDDHGDDRGDDDPAGDDRGDDQPAGDDDAAGDDRGDDADDDQDQRCGTAALTAGRGVREAELELRNGQATFTEIELLP